MGAKGVLYGTSTPAARTRGRGAYKLIATGFDWAAAAPDNISEEIFFDFGRNVRNGSCGWISDGPPGESSAFFGTTSAGANKKGDGAASIFNHELF